MKLKESHSFKVVVPAHLAAERFPEKVLVDIKGKAMLLRVLEQCQQAVSRDNVCVVTPDQKIYEIVNNWNYDVYRSPSRLPDGSSAIASVIPQLKVDYIINIQGDQPLVPPDLIKALIKNLINSGADMVTPVFRIKKLEDLSEGGMAKVVRDLDGWALYFSRNPIPYIRDVPYEKWLEIVPFWGHYGIYGFPTGVLAKLGELEESYLETGEKLEQLRWLQNGFKIFTFETSYCQLAVDTKEDLKKILKYIKRDPLE